MYNKLFTKILDSSIWLEPAATRLVWLTFIAVMDQDGFVQFAAIGNVALRARVTLEEAAAAIATLESPDPESSDPAHDGRRIERVPGGWMVLNFHKFHQTRNTEDRRRQNRESQARFRESRKPKVSQGKPEVSNGQPRSAHTDTDTDTDRVKGIAPAARAPFLKPSLAELKAHLLERHSTVDPEAFLAHYDSNGWKVGNRPMKNWKAAVITWEKNRFQPANGSIPHSPGTVSCQRCGYSPLIQLQSIQRRLCTQCALDQQRT